MYFQSVPTSRETVRDGLQVTRFLIGYLIIVLIISNVLKFLIPGRLQVADMDPMGI